MEQKKKTKKLNILYRVIPLVCSLAIAFIGIMPIKANAAEYPITNFQTSVDEYNTFRIIHFSFPDNLGRWTAYQDYAGLPSIIQNGGTGISLNTSQIGYNEELIGSNYYNDFQVDILFRPQGNNFISLDGLNDSLFRYDYRGNPYISSIYDIWYSVISSVQVNLTIRYFNGSLQEVDGRQYSGVVYKQNFNNIRLNSISWPEIYCPIEFELSVPEGAVYFQPYIYTRIFFNGYSTRSTLNTEKPFIGLVIPDRSGRVTISKANTSLNGGIDDMINQNQQIIGGQDTMINQNQQIIGNQGIEQSQNQQIIGNQNIIKDQNQQMIDNQNDLKDIVIPLEGGLDTINSNIDDIGTNIGQMHDDLVDGTPQQNNQVQGSLDNFNKSDQKLDDLTNDLKVNQPSIDPEDVAVENIVDAAMMPIFTAPLMQLWESPIIVTILTVVLTLVMISFVFFGKKG